MKINNSNIVKIDKVNKVRNFGYKFQYVQIWQNLKNMEERIDYF